MDAASNGRDKRKSERVRITSSKAIWNLSEGGAYIATTTPRSVGNLLHFEYKLEKDQPYFQALAKVVRVIHKPIPGKGEPAGMAIRFEKVSEENLERLKKFLANRKGEDH